MKQLILIFIILTLVSCQSNKIPTHKKVFSGLILTCDSVNKHLTKDPVIYLRMVKQINNQKYLECSEKPRCFDSLPFWPGILFLDFRKNHTWSYLTCKPLIANGPCVAKGLNPFHHDDVGGPWQIDKKKKTLTLNDKDGTRTYSYDYSKETHILTLKLKNSH